MEPDIFFSTLLVKNPCLGISSVYKIFLTKHFVQPCFYPWLRIYLFPDILINPDRPGGRGVFFWKNYNPSQKILFSQDVRHVQKVFSQDVRYVQKVFHYTLGMLKRVFHKMLGMFKRFFHNMLGMFKRFFFTRCQVCSKRFFHNMLGMFKRFFFTRCQVCSKGFFTRCQVCS